MPDLPAQPISSNVVVRSQPSLEAASTNRGSHAWLGLYRSLYQHVAMLFCLLLGIAIILNVELSGNAMWFWYATLFHQGTKLYQDMHLALQPLFVLEIDAWMSLVGNKVIPNEMLSVIHVVVFSLGLLLLLQESTWPDWQKGIALASAFAISIQFNAYLFDDYHVLSDIFATYTIVLLLRLGRTDDVARQMLLAGGLGVLSGLSVTNRVNDGAGLLAGTVFCVLLIARRRKLMLAGIVISAAALMATLVVRMTGDSFSDYASNTILKAAGSKGGAGTILQDPILLFFNALKVLRAGGKWILLWVGVIFASGAAVQRFWKQGNRYIIPLQLAIAAVAFAGSSAHTREELLSGALPGVLSIFFLVISYVLLPVVALRFLLSKFGREKREWDNREVLTVLVLSIAAAASASTAGASQNFFETMATLLLLAAVIQPLRSQGPWLNASLVTLFILLGVSGVSSKVQDPYSWHNYRTSPMFRNRVWYKHPIYGSMYMERSEFNFIVPVCEDVSQGGSKAELLSLPYPYPNYFCATPPWHEYVQTFFDTSTRATISKLIEDLQTEPPLWIVYQRQMENLAAHERLFNHGQPLAQRDLDDLIMQQISTGRWQLIEKRSYLEGDGWLIIRTHR